MMEKNEIPFKITPQILLEMALRRRWIILSSMCIALIVGIILLFVLPRTYKAKTLIIIEGQRVPQDYVRSIITENTAQRIETIKQQILSTSNLDKIIKDFQLFKEAKYQKLFLEDKVAYMRKRISVDLIGDRRQTEAFTISFEGKDPEKVMKVTNGLATYFIDENLKVRQSTAIGTSRFLDSELETSRLKLEKVEEAIKNYRKNHMGELPEQLETNLKIMERLQESLSNKQQQLREQKLRLADLQNSSGRNGTQVVVIDGNGQGRRTPEAGTSVEELRAELKSLQSRYTDKHPDIIRLKSRIAELESGASGSSGQENGPGGRWIPLEIRARISAARREIEVVNGEIADLNRKIADYQQRVEDTPKREQELLGLKRDYQNIQASYDSLLNRKMEADIAVNMEVKQKGEQFRVVDPARLPQRPAKPNTRKLFVLIVALGLAVGGGTAFLLERQDTSFRHPDEIESAYEIPVLAAIPFIQKEKDIIFRKINNKASIAFAGFVCVLLMVFGLLSIVGPTIVNSIFNNA